MSKLLLSSKDVADILGHDPRRFKVSSKPPRHTKFKRHKDIGAQLHGLFLVCLAIVAVVHALKTMPLRAEQIVNVSK